MKIIDFSRAPNPKRLRLFVAETGIEVGPEFPHLRRWYEETTSRPSVQDL